jgi:hypothetical protein
MTVGADDTIEAGTAAWQRSRDHGRRNFDDWIHVATSLISAASPQMGGRHEAVGSNPWRDHNAEHALWRGTYASSAATDLAQCLSECMHKHRPRSLDPFLALEGI